MKENRIFPCYSVPLRDFLIFKGFKYELVGLHPESKCMFWVFIKTNKLRECLEQWQETRSKI